MIKRKYTSGQKSSSNFSDKSKFRSYDVYRVENKKINTTLKRMIFIFKRRDKKNLKKKNSRKELYKCYKLF